MTDPRPTTNRGRRAGGRELRAWASADEFETVTRAAESAGVTREQFIRDAALGVAKAVAAALEERMTTADVPWRVHGCQCPADSKPGDRCDHRWSRCNGRLQWLKARKVTGEGR
jgi:hypothetical protein